MNAADTLINAIITRQTSSGLNETKFALLLGIPRTTWVQHKNGTRPIGKALLRAVVRTYPDLEEEVLAYLRNGLE